MNQRNTALMVEHDKRGIEDGYLFSVKQETSKKYYTLTSTYY